jgi:hypothetical protein
VAAQLELAEDLQRLRQGLAALVGAVAGGQRLENFGDAHDAGLHAHLLAGKSLRVALPVHALDQPIQM